MIHDYDEAIAYLEHLVATPVCNEPGAGLARARLMLAHVGDPQERFATLHVTGSSGKGSTAAMAAAILRAAGYRTGIFSSPHLEAYTERIAVDGAPIAPSDWTRLLNRLHPFVEQMAGGALPGYTLGRPYWSQGYMREALTALIGIAFGPLDLNRLEADIDPRNDASARIWAPVVDAHHRKHSWDSGRSKQRGRQLAGAKHRGLAGVEVGRHHGEGNPQMLERGDSGQRLCPVDQAPHVLLGKGAQLVAPDARNQQSERVSLEDAERGSGHPDLAQHHGPGQRGVRRDRGAVQGADARPDDRCGRFDVGLEERLQNADLRRPSRPSPAQHPRAPSRPKHRVLRLGPSGALFPGRQVSALFVRQLVDIRVNNVHRRGFRPAQKTELLLTGEKRHAPSGLAGHVANRRRGR